MAEDTSLDLSALIGRELVVVEQGLYRIVAGLVADARLERDWLVLTRRDVVVLANGCRIGDGFFVTDDRADVADTVGLPAPPPSWIAEGGFQRQVTSFGVHDSIGLFAPPTVGVVDAPWQPALSFAATRLYRGKWMVPTPTELPFQATEIGLAVEEDRAWLVEPGAPRALDLGVREGRPFVRRAGARPVRLDERELAEGEEAPVALGEELRVGWVRAWVTLAAAAVKPWIVEARGMKGRSWELPTRLAPGEPAAPVDRELWRV